MAKNSISIIVDAPLATLMQVITDYEAFPEFIPELENIQVKRVNENTNRVTYTVNLIKKITYTVESVVESESRVSWSLVKGDFMKKNQGRWLLESLGDNQTKVIYEIEMTFGMLVPSSLVSTLQERNLPIMMEQFKTRAESLVD